MTASTTEYYLNALGMCCALGDNPEAVLSNLHAGQAPGMQQQSGWIPERDVHVGTVQAALPAWPETLSDFASRNSRLLAEAARQIGPDIQRLRQRYGADRIGVVIGSSTSGIAEGERAIAQSVSAGSVPSGYHYRQQEIGSPALALARLLELSGPACTISTACTSSARALASGRNLLQLGLCDAVLVGGADSLCRLTLNGFAALDAVSAGRCRPFCVDRDGINVGEGAALFVLSREPGAVRLLGIGESSDAHHISAPEPEGRGAEAAMRGALADAGMAPAAVHYINLHGTATPLNDAMESRAVHRVFGDQTPCTSTKALTGHTLGAAGGIEAALCWLLLQDARGEVPAQRFDTAPDPDLAPIGLLHAPLALPAAGTGRVMLSNSFAFGGNNCSLLLGT